MRWDFERLLNGKFIVANVVLRPYVSRQENPTDVAVWFDEAIQDILPVLKDKVRAKYVHSVSADVYRAGKREVVLGIRVKLYASSPIGDALQEAQAVVDFLSDLAHQYVNWKREEAYAKA